MRKYISDKSHIALTVISLLGFIAFVTNLYKALSDGNIDAVELHQLSAFVDGFAAVIFFVMAIFIKNKRK